MAIDDESRLPQVPEHVHAVVKGMVRGDGLSLCLELGGRVGLQRSGGEAEAPRQ